MLKFSKVGQVENAIQTVDLNEVYKNIVFTLMHKFEEDGIDITLAQPLPTINCDKVRIGEVFRNLITNAYKYNNKPEKKIVVGYTTSCDEAYTFYVKDNGIGINPKQQGKIFTIFQRLHGKEDYGGGSGVGLAIVKKIIERHNGRIWIKSVPNEGTTFYFTIQQQGQAVGQTQRTDV